jgi:uncharacterized protein YjgD (DUF1641 family)
MDEEFGVNLNDGLGEQTENLEATEKSLDEMNERELFDKVNQLIEDKDKIIAEQKEMLSSTRDGLLEILTK